MNSLFILHIFALTLTLSLSNPIEEDRVKRSMTREMGSLPLMDGEKITKRSLKTEFSLPLGGEKISKRSISKELKSLPEFGEKITKRSALEDPDIFEDFNDLESMRKKRSVVFLPSFRRRVRSVDDHDEPNERATRAVVFVPNFRRGFRRSRSVDDNDDQYYHEINKRQAVFLPGFHRSIDDNLEDENGQSDFYEREKRQAVFLPSFRRQGRSVADEYLDEAPERQKRQAVFIPSFRRRV